MTRKFLISIGLRTPLVFLRNSRITRHDIMIASYPRSGNTWLRAMLAAIIRGDVNNFEDLSYYVPEIECLKDTSAYVLPTGGRLVKTHEKWSSRYRKAVYITRDCRDVVISYYYFQLREGLFGGDFSEYFDLFLAGRLDGYGRWDHNALSWLNASDRMGGNFMLVRYEDLKSNPERELKRVLEFVGLKHSNEQVRTAVEQNDVNGMREKERRSNIERANGIPFVGGSSRQYKRVALNSAQLQRLVDDMGCVMNRLGYLLPER